MLFVYRLMFSGNGYTATLAALWEQCRACGIPLPQAEPVAASSMSAARAKVDEAIFKNLHAEILKRAESSQWKGHRVFAVDGSKINLPRPLLRAGYPLPQERAHYPQGLLSCLYELGPKLPIDFDLHAHGDERAAALAHLPAMAAGNVGRAGPIVYDRGYYSYRMLLAHAERGVHPLFRLQRNAGTTFDDFIAGSRQDELITITPGPDTLRRLGRKDPEAVPRPIPRASSCGSSNTSTAEPSSTSQPPFSTEADTRSGNSPTSTMTAGASRSCTKPQSVASNWRTSTAVPNAA